MNLKILLLISIFIISYSLNSQVKNGEIDLSNYDFKAGKPVNLSGEWKFRNGYSEEEIAIVPGSWDGGKGDVIYSLLIISSGAENLILSPYQINTKYKIFNNGRLIIEDSKNRSLQIPISLDKGKNLLEFYISNYTDIIGGFTGQPHIGSYASMVEIYEKRFLSDVICSGASFIIFIFFVILYLSYRKDKSTLYFALICFLLFIRGLVTNDKVLYTFIPSLPYVFINKLEYLTVYFLPFFLLLFIKSYFNRNKVKQVYNIIVYISGLFPAIAVFTPPVFYISYFYIFCIFAFIATLFVFIVLTVYCFRRYENASKILISIICLLFAAFYDMVLVITKSSLNLILVRAMMIFILFMSYTVSHRLLVNIKKIRKLSDDNKNVNRYLSKFVPAGFIKSIDKGSITTIRKGDGTTLNMTVLFSSIKDFHKQTRLLKGEEVIELLNRCYEIISPIIRKHGGFVDKFMDETLMALFSGGPEDALNASIEISTEMNKYNSLHNNEMPLEIRSGIHMGELYIGIVGDENRLDATVISKVVNTASRIGSFTKKIDKDILISDEVFNSLNHSDEYKTHYMGRVKLKGNLKDIGIYSVCILDSKYAKEEIHQADNLFSITMKKLENSTLSKIEDVLMNIKNIYSKHTPTLYYLKLIRENRRLEDLEK